jgi:SAM-dependent methyltransferase
MKSSHAYAVSAHYGRPGLLEAIEAGLRSLGKSPSELEPRDLAAVDQFHTRGLSGTESLAALAELVPGERVLDVGGGIGGPARTLALTRGCDVTVLDLTPEYCDVGRAMTAWLGLTDRVHFRQGDALQPVFDAAVFDVGWSQHSTMNIPEKPRLYTELHRVLRPGGRLVLHEIVAGRGGAPHFPVPWASEPAVSFLLPGHEFRDAIRGAGFVERVWRNVTAETVAWMGERLSSGGAPPPLGLHLLIGDGARAAFTNLHRNLTERRVEVVEAVFDRP